MNLTEKTGDMIATFPVTDDHQVMLISDQGQMIRMPVSGVRHTGRSTQGVRLFNVSGDEKVVSVAWLVEDNDEDDSDNEGVVAQEVVSTEASETNETKEHKE